MGKQYRTLLFSIFSWSIICSLSAFASESSAVLEAQARVDYYRAIVDGAKIYIKKAERNARWFETKLRRAQLLYNKNAGTQETLENQEALRDQAYLDIQLRKTELAAAQADLRGALATLNRLKKETTEFP